MRPKIAFVTHFMKMLSTQRVLTAGETALKQRQVMTSVLYEHIGWILSCGKTAQLKYATNERPTW